MSSAKNRFGKFWNFDPWGPQFWPEQKMTAMISKWFFASFRTLPFVFLYGDQEPRSWGRSNAPPPPPPPAGGGKSRGPAGRGLTRALEGGGGDVHLSGFSRIAFKDLLTIELDTLCKNFSHRSPGQVKVKNGFLTLRLRSGHIRYPIGFKPSAFHKVIDTYNLYILDFFYICHQRSGQFRDLTIISQWAKIQIVPTEWLGMRQNHLNPS